MMENLHETMDFICSIKALLGDMDLSIEPDHGTNLRDACGSSMSEAQLYKVCRAWL
jgi:hypothetical protein